MIVQNHPFPVMTTDRLLIRKLALSDRYEIAALRSDEEVNKYIFRKGPVNIEQAEDFIKRIADSVESNGSIYWAIALKDSDKLIGTACFWNLEPKKDQAEIGYELSTAHQGKGFMQEAIKKIVAYGFNTMRLKTITALPMPENERSIALLKKNGFVPDADHQYVSKADAGEQLVFVLTK